MINYKNDSIEKFVAEETWEVYLQNMNTHNLKLHDGSGAGSDFLGWVDLPKTALKEIPKAYNEAIELMQDKDVVVCVGIGGSYLGARAVLQALSKPFSKSSPEILFAGHHLDADYHADLLNYLEKKDFGIIVISKSGTTTEPAIAFRLLTDLLKKQGKSKQLKRHIIAITDAKKGALRNLADELSLMSFVVPDDVGGRFSVFTPVGLVPLAVAGVDVKALVEGAKDMSGEIGYEQLPGKNPALRYAAFRKLMWDKKKSVEILANTQPSLSYVAEWWKQLFGESEGKAGKGLFPASINLTTDLHSLGQYIQEGTPLMFETFLEISNPDQSLTIPHDEANRDKLNYIADKPVSYVNQQAAAGTYQAHKDGDVPVSRIVIDKNDAYHLGELLYFFEKACGMSAYALGVNPFNQPGVEAYKNNMFKLLGKK
ncbi:MAG: glucose-6-phosphate isomerase [Candidatus Delongbacteria bacterium]|jgi:glucose-6-phosphate isomerase|nr:glucose-6-phosphate isomerase [Candidatus Delongbacteria bacterium]